MGTCVFWCPCSSCPLSWPPVPQPRQPRLNRSMSATSLTIEKAGTGRRPALRTVGAYRSGFRWPSSSRNPLSTGMPGHRADDGVSLDLSAAIAHQQPRDTLKRWMALGKNINPRPDKRGHHDQTSPIQWILSVGMCLAPPGKRGQAPATAGRNTSPTMKAQADLIAKPGGGTRRLLRSPIGSPQTQTGSKRS